jgi:hypothetical protein
MVSKFADHWNKDGSVQASAPRWATLRADMQSAFPTYYSTDTSDPFANLVGEAIRYLDRLKPPKPTSSPATTPGYLGAIPLVLTMAMLPKPDWGKTWLRCRRCCNKLPIYLRECPTGTIRW